MHHLHQSSQNSVNAASDLEHILSGIHLIEMSENKGTTLRLFVPSFFSITGRVRALMAESIIFNNHSTATFLLAGFSY
jgi:hypothetical protein